MLPRESNRAAIVSFRFVPSQFDRHIVISSRPSLCSATRLACVRNYHPSRIQPFPSLLRLRRPCTLPSDESRGREDVNNIVHSAPSPRSADIAEQSAGNLFELQNRANYGMQITCDMMGRKWVSLTLGGTG